MSNAQGTAHFPLVSADHRVFALGWEQAGGRERPPDAPASRRENVRGPDDQESRPGRSDALGAPTVLRRLGESGRPLDPPGPDIRVRRLSSADHVAATQSTPRVGLSNRPSIASHSVLARAKMRRCCAVRCAGAARSTEPPQRLFPDLLAVEPRDGDPRHVETVPRVVSHDRRVAPQELDALVA